MSIHLLVHNLSNECDSYRHLKQLYNKVFHYTIDLRSFSLQRSQSASDCVVSRSLGLQVMFNLCHLLSPDDKVNDENICTSTN